MLCALLQPAQLYYLFIPLRVPGIPHLVKVRGLRCSPTLSLESSNQINQINQIQTPASPCRAPAVIFLASSMENCHGTGPAC